MVGDEPRVSSLDYDYDDDYDCEHEIRCPMYISPQRRGGGEGSPSREGAKHFFLSMESRAAGLVPRVRDTHVTAPGERGPLAAYFSRTGSPPPGPGGASPPSRVLGMVIGV